MELKDAHKEILPEKIEDVKDEGLKFHCELFDTEVVHKIAQMLVPGLATVCVDNTIGDMLYGPGYIATEMRKQMLEYINQRSESFVAESVVLEGGVSEGQTSDHPYDIISSFVDDFANSNRSLFGQVSSWLQSENREDKIEDFIQEMQQNGFWMIDKRDTIAQTLLKNVDFKNSFHCDKKFDSSQELSEHVRHCKYRSVTCENERCGALFSACYLEGHDSICPFKTIPCEQKCSATLMRRDMDRHCLTACPMRLANCPFYSVGCPSRIPHCKIEQHRADDLHSHLLYILRGIYKEASEGDLEKRNQELEQVSVHGLLRNARDSRSLTSIVKELESKLGPMEFSVKHKDAVESSTESRDKNNNEDAATTKSSDEEHNIKKRDSSNCKQTPQ